MAFQFMFTCLFIFNKQDARPTRPRDLATLDDVPPLNNHRSQMSEAFLVLLY